LTRLGRNTRPSGPTSNAGKTIRSPARAAASIENINQAKRLMGPKGLKTYTKRPRPQINVVWIIAVAQREYEKAIASRRDWPRASPRRNHVRKCSVSSTAMPRAAAAVIIEPTSICTPSIPMAPKTTIAGNTLGIIETSPARKLRSKITMVTAMKTNAMAKLPNRSSSNCCCDLCTMGTLPV